MLCSSLKNLSLRQEGPKLCQGGFHNIEDNGIDDDLVGDDDDCVDDDRMMMEITMNILYYTYIIHCICRFVQPTIPPTEAKVSLFEAKKYNAWQ